MMESRLRDRAIGDSGHAGFKGAALQRAENRAGIVGRAAFDPTGRLLAGDQYGGALPVTLAADRHEHRTKNRAARRPAARHCPPRPAPSRAPRRNAPPRPTAPRRPPSARTACSNAFDSLYVMVDEVRPSRGSGGCATRMATISSTSSISPAMNGSGEHGPHSSRSRPTASRSTSPMATTPICRKHGAGRMVGWGEDHCCRGCGRPRPRAQQVCARRIHRRMGPTAKRSSSFDRLPQPVRPRLRSQRRALHLRLRHGVGPGHALVLPTRINHAITAPTSAGAAAPAAARVLRRTASTRSSISDPARPRASRSAPARNSPTNSGALSVAADWPSARSTRFISRRTADVSRREDRVPLGQTASLTDVVINPRDGAMYFAVGGRRTQSALYRVTYVATRAPHPPAFRR